MHLFVIPAEGAGGPDLKSHVGLKIYFSLFLFKFGLCSCLFVSWLAVNFKYDLKN